MEKIVSLTKNEILKFLKQNREHLRDHFHIKKIGLFGSFVHDEQTNESDIDLIIELEEQTPAIFELKQELRELISKQFNRDVDIAREKYLKAYVKDQILEEALYVE